MVKNSVLAAWVVVLMLMVALMPSAALAQSPWQWPYGPPQWPPAQPQQPPGPGSWALVSPGLFVDEGFQGQLVLTMRLTSNSQKLEQVQAIVTLGPDFPGYFVTSNNWGVSVSGKNGSWVVQLQPYENAVADILIQLQGVTSQQLRQGCLIASMTTSVRDANGYWQPNGYPLQITKSW